MRSPDVPEDVRRILKTAADLMEHAAAHLDRGQVAEAAAAAHRAKRNPPRWPRRVWSVIFGAFVLGAALAWFLTPPEERAPTNVKAAGVASVAPITRLEDAPADPLVLRLETELAQSVPTR
ncbi:MAG: hypothetical protein JOZ85_14900 [Betaproteobacteria bacterium]|nr:hypothetical protein [Betaproteobacteria bacterium]